MTNEDGRGRRTVLHLQCNHAGASDSRDNIKVGSEAVKTVHRKRKLLRLLNFVFTNAAGDLIPIQIPRKHLSSFTQVPETTA